MSESPLVIVSVAHHPEPGPRYDPGATSPDGTLVEAHWSLRLCRLLAEELRASGRLRVELLNLPLARTILALRTRHGVDLVVEPHLNAGLREHDYAVVIPRGNAPVAMAAARALTAPLSALRAGAGFAPRCFVWPAPLDWKQLGLMERQPHPALLTEAGFVDAPGFAAFVAQPDTLHALARLHARAVEAALGVSFRPH